MELLLWVGGVAGLLLVLALVVGRRQRRSATDPHRPPSPGAPASGSPGTNSWPLGGAL